MSSYKEYTVTTNSLEKTDSVWDDLTSRSGSTTIPDRIVEVANPREINPYNTVYFLTDKEAEDLKHDSRVKDVQDISNIPIIKHAFQDSEFNKTTSSSGAKVNWGLLRHSKNTNVFGSLTSDPGGTYDYVLDGTGVDVVIVDSGIQIDHPEFTTLTGGITRASELDWYQASGVTGSMPSNFYTDYDGHGTHVAATAAGKTFGWAKGSTVYSIKLSGLKGVGDPSAGMSVADMFDCILGFHLNKSSGNPTVVNNSWGYGLYWHETDGALSFSSDPSEFQYPITGGVYRGTNWAGSVKDPAKGHTGSPVDAGIYSMPIRISSVDADISLLSQNGIIVCNSAGNDYTKIDRFFNLDWNNYVSATGFGNYYYHRGSSPSAAETFAFDVGSVGASVVGGLDRKSSFSNSGPGVDIWAAGGSIMSAVSNTNDGNTNFPYYLNSSYKQQVLSGTSMASPQIAGMCALLLQAHRNWTPRQVYQWMTANAEPDLYTTGSETDYSTTSSIHGGYNRMAYMPLAAQKYYQMIAS